MRALTLALLCALTGCASATVLQRSEEQLTLRWDADQVSRARLMNQAIDLCSAYGSGARRPVAIADEAVGTVHTTRFACQSRETPFPITAGPAGAPRDR